MDRRQQRPTQEAVTDPDTAWKPDLRLTVTQTHMAGHVCQCTVGISLHDLATLAPVQRWQPPSLLAFLFVVSV